MNQRVWAIGLAMLACGCGAIDAGDAATTCPLDDSGTIVSADDGPNAPDPDDVASPGVDAAVDVAADASVVPTGLADLDAHAAPYNARGDGRTDDTASIQRALDAAGAVASAARPVVVFLPAGKYRVASHLHVPPFVALTGSSRAPADESSFVVDSGSMLLAVEGAGHADATPFITLDHDATLAGMIVFHPDQRTTADPIPYPWTVRAAGAHVTVRDTMLVNPYRGVDLGSARTDGHLIHGLYGQPLSLGMVVDHCAGGGRIEDVHFFVWWIGAGNTPTRDYMEANATALVLLHATGEVITDYFSIGFATGMRFGQSGTTGCDTLPCGSNSGTMTNVGFDSTGVCLDVLDTEAAGWNVSNMLCAAVVGRQLGIWHHGGATTHLTVEGAAFWSGAPLTHAVLWEAGGDLTLTEAAMTAWAPSGAAIDVTAGHVTVMSSRFGDGVGTAIAASGGGGVTSVANLRVGDGVQGSVSSRGDVN